MRILAVSDLHGHLPGKIPECDLLLLGGDYTDHQKGFIERFRRWLKDLPCKVIGIAGNHDFELLDEELARGLPWTYLFDSEASHEGIRIYGTPWTPKFYDWAFMKDEEDLKPTFQKIPEGINILLSHGPAFQRLDKTYYDESPGSKNLLDRIEQVAPKVVICGHIHEARGAMEVGGTKYYNVSYVNAGLQPTGKIVTVWETE